MRRWRLVVVGVVLVAVMRPGFAQVRCTMPNGVEITMQLNDCPSGAVSARALDGTPIAIKQTASVAQGASRSGAADATASTSSSTQKEAETRASGGFNPLSWMIVSLVLYGLFSWLRGAFGTSGPVRYCTTCGHKGRGVTRTRGSLLIEIVLWLCFIVPGLIYSLWRHASKHKVCASCGSAMLVPPDSPIAKVQMQIQAQAQTRDDATQSPPDKDAWEGSFYDVAEQRSAKKTVRISYLDGNESVTERVVDIRAFEPHAPDGLVIGFCRLRRATRTFRFDRMRRVVDEETGEIIPDLQQCLNAEWEASPEPVMDNLYRQHGDMLKMMLYAAKADGSMRMAELQVIAGYCCELTDDDRITPVMVREMLALLGVPTVISFTRIYNKLRRERPEDAARAARACRAIVATHKTLHPTEQAMLAVLDKPLPASKV